MNHPLRTVLLVLAAVAASAAGLPAQQGADTSAEAAARRARVATPRPGDQVALKIWNEEEMSDTFNISERGEVILPKLGPVYVIDKPVGALQDSLRKAYSVYLRNPSIDIVVLRRIGVQGEVRLPGIYLADLTVGLPEIIARAGGYTDAGNPRNIVIVRDGERVRYGGRSDEGLVVSELQSGDQIFVRPRSAFARNPMAWIGGAMGLVATFNAVVWPLVKEIIGKDE